MSNNCLGMVCISRTSDPIRGRCCPSVPVVDDDPVVRQHGGPVLVCQSRRRVPPFAFTCLRTTRGMIFPRCSASTVTQLLPPLRLLINFSILPEGMKAIQLMLNLLLISTRQSGFNLSTGEWQALPSMQKARAFATGIAHKGKFYVFGGATPKHSAEIYDPLSNTWLSIDSFVPEEADGFAVTSTFMNLVILTWSDRLGLKLWLRVEKSNEALENGTWTIVSDLPNNEEVDRLRFRHHGAKMVKLGNEVCVLMGETDCVWRVGGPVAWPIFPSPNFCPGGGHEVVHDGETYAFSIQADGTRFA
ncbi:F-box/kelch-repeat protein At1g74510-like [Cornus florida]|uniref:F-box/kelch-repeat protein At1g74510-like n=1 Tax=Cornus florida TaxID=4283 RepID=UPI002897B6F4|nr:F-box/kelch-repeat protein At1g74510-like [Cornus florida]XP_059660747.1 F-box/kelch-repeat protein At1g74510-like [Cornus florida]XP_059660748.1 F-box/kelch-repeat protein At1g74510-like [Cornus florida]